MSSKSKIGLAYVFGMLHVSGCRVVHAGAMAAAQEQPAPKWELYGGYSSSIPAPTSMACFPEGSCR